MEKAAWAIAVPLSIFVGIITLWAITALIHITIYYKRSLKKRDKIKEHAIKNKYIEKNNKNIENIIKEYPQNSGFGIEAQKYIYRFKIILSRHRYITLLCPSQSRIALTFTTYITYFTMTMIFYLFIQFNESVSMWLQIFTYGYLSSVYTIMINLIGHIIYDRIQTNAPATWFMKKYKKYIWIDDSHWNVLTRNEKKLQKITRYQQQQQQQQQQIDETNKVTIKPTQKRIMNQLSEKELIKANIKEEEKEQHTQENNKKKKRGGQKHISEKQERRRERKIRRMRKNIAAKKIQRTWRVYYTLKLKDAMHKEEIERLRNKNKIKNHRKRANSRANSMFSSDISNQSSIYSIEEIDEDNARVIVSAIVPNDKLSNYTASSTTSSHLSASTSVASDYVPGNENSNASPYNLYDQQLNGHNESEATEDTFAEHDLTSQETRSTRTDMSDSHSVASSQSSIVYNSIIVPKSALMIDTQSRRYKKRSSPTSSNASLSPGGRRGYNMEGMPTQSDDMLSFENEFIKPQQSDERTIKRKQRRRREHRRFGEKKMNLGKLLKQQNNDHELISSIISPRKGSYYTEKSKSVLSLTQANAYLDSTDSPKEEEEEIKEKQDKKKVHKFNRSDSSIEVPLDPTMNDKSMYNHYVTVDPTVKEPNFDDVSDKRLQRSISNLHHSISKRYTHTKDESLSTNLDTICAYIYNSYWIPFFSNAILKWITTILFCIIYMILLISSMVWFFFLPTTYYSNPSFWINLGICSILLVVMIAYVTYTMLLQKYGGRFPLKIYVDAFFFIVGTMMAITLYGLSFLLAEEAIIKWLSSSTIAMVLDLLLFSHIEFLFVTFTSLSWSGNFKKTNDRNLVN